MNLDKYGREPLIWKPVTNLNGEIPPCQMIKCLPIDEFSIVLFGGLDKVNHLFSMKKKMIVER